MMTRFWVAIQIFTTGIEAVIIVYPESLESSFARHREISPLSRKMVDPGEIRDRAFRAICVFREELSFSSVLVEAAGTASSFLEEAGELKAEVPYNELVTMDFSKKAAKNSQ